MKKFWMILLAILPIGLWAQDNTWELPEEEQRQEETTLEAKINPNAKYLRGAVPEVDGKVVFSKTIEAPGKSAAQIYTILHNYMVKMTKASNQINSHLIVEDSVKQELGASFEESSATRPTSCSRREARSKRLSTCLRQMPRYSSIMLTYLTMSTMNGSPLSISLMSMPCCW